MQWVGGWNSWSSNQDELLSLENTTLTRVRDILYVSVGGAKSYVSGPLLCICQCCIVDRVRSDTATDSPMLRLPPTSTPSIDANGAHVRHSILVSHGVVTCALTIGRG